MRFILLFLLLFGARLSAQVSLYVSPLGNDSAFGSLLQPWKTIQHAVDHAAPGCTIYLMAGTYHENVVMHVSGTNNQPIVLTRYPGQLPLIDGSGTNGTSLLTITNVNYVTIRDLEFTHLARNNSSAILISGKSSNVEIYGNRIHDIHFSSDPLEPVTPASFAHAIAVMGTDTNNACSHISIAKNEISNCRIGNAAAIEISGNADAFSVLRNTVHDVSNSGIAVTAFKNVCLLPVNDQPHDGGISWNTTWNCNSSNGAAAGILIDGARMMTVENNLVKNNDKGIRVTCVQAGKRAESILVRDNVISRNLSAGVEVGGDAASGYVYMSSLNCNTIFGNNISGNQTELLIGYTEFLTVNSNIIDGYDHNALVQSDAGSQSLSLKFNLYHASTSPEFSWNANVASSLPAWQTMCACDSFSLVADPFFADPAAGNLHLLGNSPAIDRGDSLYLFSALEKDMDTMARVQNSRVDIGADEYGTAVGISSVTINDQFHVVYNRSSSDLAVYFPKPSARDTRVVILTADGRFATSAEVKKGAGNVHVNVSALSQGAYLVYTEGMDASAVKFVR